MGLDKRRGVVGHKYGASFAKQATVYGIFLVVLAALVIGGKLAADELDQGRGDRGQGSVVTGGRRADAPGDPDFHPASRPSHPGSTGGQESARGVRRDTYPFVVVARIRIHDRDGDPPALARRAPVRRRPPASPPAPSPPPRRRSAHRCVHREHEHAREASRSGRQPPRRSLSPTRGPDENCDVVEQLEDPCGPVRVGLLGSMPAASIARRPAAERDVPRTCHPSAMSAAPSCLPRQPQATISARANASTSSSSRAIAWASASVSSSAPRFRR